MTEPRPILAGPVARALTGTSLDDTRVAVSASGHDFEMLADMLVGAGALVSDAPVDSGYLLEAAPGPASPAAGTLSGAVTTSATSSAALARSQPQLPIVAVHVGAIGRLVRAQRGRRILQAVMRLTNRRIAASSLAITGYGPEARSVASAAVGLGAGVTVVTSDPLEALAARHDGHDIASDPHRSGFVVVVDGRTAPALDDLERGALLVLPDGTAPTGAPEVRPGVFASDGVFVTAPGIGWMDDEADLMISVAVLSLAAMIQDPPSPGAVAPDPTVEQLVASFAMEPAR